MINLLLSGLVFAALLSGCGWDGTATRNNDFTPLTSIEISADYSTIAARTSTRLTAKGNYSGLFSRDITAQVVWTSAAPAVAGFVTPAVPNRVTGQTPGTAVLTATMGKVASTFTLTVSPATVTALTVTPVNPSLAKGLSSQFIASGTFSDATTQDLTFDADWVSSAPAAATIGNDPLSKGLAQAVAEGTTTLTATFADRSSSTLLTVTGPALQSITISPVNPTIPSITRTSFKALGSYSDGSTADITAQAAWSSASSDIATVTADGVAKTLAPGTVSLSAALAGVSGTSTIKVTGGILTRITISPTNPRLVKDTTVRISASGAFSNGTTRDISGAVDWTVDNAFATVNPSGGNLVFLNPIAATAGTILKAKSGVVFADTTLTVTAPPFIRNVALDPIRLEQTAGTSDLFTLTAFFSDGSTQDVTLSSDWTSDAAATAAVGNSGIDKGRVSAVANGSAIISASYGGITDKATITVRSRTLRDLTISGTTSAVIGNQVALTATASYTDGTNKDVTEETSWSIDNTNIATLADPLNQPGQIVMVDGGRATLSVSFGNQSKTLTLTSQGL